MTFLFRKKQIICPLFLSFIGWSSVRAPLSQFSCGLEPPSFTVCLVGERGEPGRSEPVPVAVWLEDERVGLAPGWNIPLRCGLAPSLKI
jgi:hypothetical protein